MMIRLFTLTNLLCFLLLHLSVVVSGQGIVIAHEKEQTELFNSDSTIVDAFADGLALKYNKVILHLGNSAVFKRGNIFSSEKSKNNLKIFARRLKSKDIPLTLWFLDCFGKESFDRLYDGYKEICDANLAVLDSLAVPYHGIIVDIEWINLHNGNNNSKFEEILAYLRHKIPQNAKLYFFASLHDTRKENIDRGYDTDRLAHIADAPIAMFYPSDAGFHMDGKKIKPNWDTQRIQNLKDFYKKQRWNVTVSLKSTWICQLRHDQTEMEVMSAAPENQTDRMKMGQISHEGLWEIRNFTVVKPLLVNLKDGRKQMLSPGDLIFNYMVSEKILSPENYIWEYYRLQTDYQIKD